MSGNRDVAKCIYPEEHGILTHVKQAPDRPSTSCEWGAKDRRESRVRNIEGCGIKKSCPCHSSSFVVADVYRICISESLEASWKKKMVLIRDLDGGRSKGPYHAVPGTTRLRVLRQRSPPLASSIWWPALGRRVHLQYPILLYGRLISMTYGRSLGDYQMFISVTCSS